MEKPKIMFKCAKCNSTEWHLSVVDGETDLYISSPCGNSMRIIPVNFEGFVNTILDKECPLQ